MLKLFKEGLPCEHEFEKRENGLVAEVVSAIVEYKQIPHYQLVTFWAAHGNATPVSDLVGFIFGIFNMAM